MGKYCPNCGKELEEGAQFCGSCGANLNGGSQAQVATPSSHPVVPNRSVVTSILLTIVTCGIYGIYWMVTLQDDSNLICDDNKTSGITVVLLTLVTCGIYGWVWYYKMGQRLAQAGQKYGIQIADNSVVYLIVGLLGFGIVDYCLMQSDLNKFSGQ